jgi:cell division protein FtsL
MTSIEHRQLKGITIKNIVVTILSTASIVISVMASYFQLKGDINELNVRQEAQTRVNEVRLRVLEEQVTVLQHQMEQITTTNNK